jgi:hypothetical protein
MTSTDEKQRRMTLRRDIGNRDVPKAGPTGPLYLRPYACFACRRSYRRPARGNPPVLPCPHCGSPSIGLSRTFKAPKRSDPKQWAKVESLVRHGFLFWKLGEPYPATLREVAAFAQRHATFIRDARRRFPEAYEGIEDALARIGRRVP